MARTFSALKALCDSRLGKSAGTLTISDYQSALNMALDGFLQEVDMPEAQKTQTLSPALFKDVLTYNPPSDVRGDSIIDIRPLTEIPHRAIRNGWQRHTTVDFSTNNLGDRVLNTWTFEFDNGTKYLKLLGDPQDVQNVSIHNCDTYDGNGTWTADTATSDATNVKTDTVNYFEGSGSVSFDIDVSQSANNYASIYNASMSAVDISDMDDEYLFYYVYLPTGMAATLSSMNAYLSSDSSGTPATIANYYAFAATTQFNGQAFVDGRNLIGVARSSATQTGTCDLSSIKYVQLRLNYTAATTDRAGILLDGIFMREGVLYEMRYYTKNIIVPATGSNKQYFTVDDDTTLMSPDAEMAFIEYATMFIAPNLKDFSNVDVFTRRAMQALANYKRRYPSERRKTMKNWYQTGSFD